MTPAWRLVRPERGTADAAFSGLGARLYGGRWNSPGRTVVYTSATLSLAALETLVHADQRAFMRDYVAFRVTVPDDAVLDLAQPEVPASWRARPVSPAARAVGDAWLRDGASLGLWVPSAVVPLERNLLLDPEHPRWPEVQLSEPVPFRFDARLEPGG
ncbi:MAG TPA: RES family NAD+ phosphorylase [Trueperaceae bacterium]|nr:RES family NAD+ phosphorylase [Trueperaceae bacterium]